MAPKLQQGDPSTRQDLVPHVGAKLFQRFGFGKDRLTKRPSCIPAFGRLLNAKYQFVHFVRVNWPLMFLTLSVIRR
jgi:hypothetical protein